jgi:hypothetical protein
LPRSDEREAIIEVPNGIQVDGQLKPRYVEISRVSMAARHCVIDIGKEVMSPVARVLSAYTQFLLDRKE